MQGAHINLIRDLGFKPEQAMKLYCDNKATINISHNPGAT